MKQKIRVLILEDRPSDAKLMVAELTLAGFDLTWERVDTAEEYLRELDKAPDVVLSDYNLPQFDAPSALKLLAERGIDIPFIVVSGSIGEEIAVQAIKQGAADYLLKDRLGRLGSAVSHALKNRQLREEKRQLEEQYRHSQKMEAVGKLAGGVAHDFNNLLTVIMGYSDLYLSILPPGDSMRTPFIEIGKAGERAASLTRQLLTFSRKQVLQPVVLDLNVILADMEKMLCRLIGADVSLTFLPEKSVWRVKADVGQMDQVVMNLVINARDAMPHGGKLLVETKNVTLEENYVQTHVQAQPGDYVMLAVSDTGCGMSPEVRTRIFEPFFTTKDPGKGTGLGLATVYGIVKQAGGHVEVYSEVGQGTTFKIYLPRDRSGESAAAIARPGDPVRGGTETILLVEDEEGVGALAKVVLQRKGYAILDARNGTQALSIGDAAAKPIDLLVTDVVMPKMSGRQLADRMTVAHPKMAVLYVSGYTDDAIIHHGVLEAGTPFLQKPFTPDALARKVREVLDEAQKR